MKPASPLPFEFCENGVKAVAWELTAHRCTPKFFAEHTVTELRGWDDFHLEQPGRLTHPLRYAAASDKYVPVSWGHALEEIAQELRAVEDRHKGTVFYSSGRLSNEASYLYQLFARLYGNNNLPDSSNMCHETTSVALPASIGQAVGTVTLEDFGKSDCILFFGQNPGSNAPRMLHPLQEASERGVPINHLQSAARARAGTVPEPAIADRDADRQGYPDQLAVSPGQGWRRSRRVGGHLQGGTGHARGVTGSGRPGRAGRGLHRRAHPRLRDFRRLASPPELGRVGAPFGPPPRGYGSNGARLLPIARRDRRLRHGADPAPSRGRDRADAGQPPVDAR